MLCNWARRIRLIHEQQAVVESCWNLFELRSAWSILQEAGKDVASEVLAIQPFCYRTIRGRRSEIHDEKL
jgi:hypothetical protein